MLLLPVVLLYKSISPDRNVITAGEVTVKGINPDSCVIGSRAVAEKGLEPDGCVIGPRAVAHERRRTDSRIAPTKGIIEGVVPYRRVITGCRYLPASNRRRCQYCSTHLCYLQGRRSRELCPGFLR